MVAADMFEHATILRTAPDRLARLIVRSSWSERESLDVAIPKREVARRISGRSNGGWWIAVLMVSACTTVPVGVKRADPRTVQRHLTASALSGSTPSMASRVALNRLNFTDSFDDDPD